MDERRGGDTDGWAEEERWLDRLADDADREGCEPSLSLSEMARELGVGGDGSFGHRALDDGRGDD